MKVLAIDYGKSRCGLAVTDENQIIASGLCTVETPGLMKYLDDFFRKNNVSALVVGLPRFMDGSLMPVEEEIAKFLDVFTKKYPSIHVVRVDERFTSKMALQSMIDAGLKKKERRNKALVDEISATILLQSYLDSRR